MATPRKNASCSPLKRRFFAVFIVHFAFYWTLQPEKRRYCTDMPEREIVAVTEFARRVGCAQSTARDYLATGKIHGEAIHQPAAGKKPKLVYEIAKAQFLEARTNAELRFANSNHALATGRTRGAEPEPAPEPEADPDPYPYRAQTLEELEADPDKVTVYSRYAPPVIMPREFAERMKLRTRPFTDEDEDAEDFNEPPPPKEPKKARLRPVDTDGGTPKENPLVSVARGLTQEELAQLSPPELAKRESVLRVLEKQVDLEKKLGDVIRREDVHAALFTFGQEIRQRIEAVPDRIADTLFASKDRNELFLTLQRELNAALTRLADADKLELSTNRKTTSRAAR